MLYEVITLSEAGLAFLRRIHAPPDSEAIEYFSRFLHTMHINLPRRPDRKDMQALLDSVRGRPAARVVNRNNFV